MKYYIRTFGCQMNLADSERFATIVESIGYQPTDKPDQADLIILNSCSVRQKAEDRVIGQGNKIIELKQKNPKLKAILTGCMARRTWRGVNKTGSQIQMTIEAREEQLKKQMPWLDIVLETKDFGKLPQKLGINNDIKEAPEFYLSYKPKITSNFQAFMPISTGCDHFCTFCIVPFARGGEVCRDADSIIKELEQLVDKGYKDITLLGQTVNRWISPKYDQELKQGRIANTNIPGLNQTLLDNNKLKEHDPKDFLQLVQTIDQITGDWWFTFVSSHPNYMTEELISYLATAKHFRPYLHFALQSGANEILKRMNRRYTVEEFVEKTLKFKKIIPGVAISTDIIVGFPGETEAQFLKTAEVMKLLEFDLAFISEFSPRKGTAAGLLRDDISHTEKTRRKNYLNDDVLAVTALKNNQRMLGTTQKVIIIHRKNDSEFMGKTANFKDITLNSREKTTLTKDLVGKFVQAKVTACTPWALTGQLLDLKI